MNFDTFRHRQGVAQFEERDVRILGDQFLEKRVEGRELASPKRAPLRRGMSVATCLDQLSHRAPVAGDSFKRMAAARPLRPSSIYR